jgi:uncharacterized membrane protein (UPF0127 family)
MSRPHFLQSVLAGRDQWGLRIERDGTWLSTNAVLAGSSQARRQGLLGRESMAEGEALVIAPTQGVHTFGMHFDIDVLGVTRDGSVVTLRVGVPRRRVVFSWRAFAMVELAAGATDRSGLRLGDRILAVRDGIRQS